MANNTYTSIEVTEEAILGENRLYFIKDIGINITNDLPYAKIDWANGNGTASYNKGSIIIKYEKGILVSAKTDVNVSLVKDSNNGGSFYFKKINTTESFNLSLDYVLTSKPLVEEPNNIPVLSAVSNVDVPEPVEVCKNNIIFNIDGIKILDGIQSKNVVTDDMVSLNSDISKLSVKELAIDKNINIKNPKDDGLSFINSGLYKLNNKVDIPLLKDEKAEIIFNFDSGLVVASILDENQKSLVDFTLIKNSIKTSDTSDYKSNIILSYSQMVRGYLTKLKETTNGISLIASSELSGKTLSFGIISSDDELPSIRVGIEQITENKVTEYQIDKVRHTLILGDPQECGLLINGDIKVNNLTISNSATINTVGESEISVVNRKIVTEMSNSSKDEAIATSNSYTDQKKTEIDERLNKLESDLKLNLTNINAKINSINDSIIIEE